MTYNCYRDSGFTVPAQEVGSDFRASVKADHWTPGECYLCPQLSIMSWVTLIKSHYQLEMASVGLSPDSRYWWYFQDTCRLLNAFLVWKRQRFLLIEAGSYVWVWITSRLSYHGILCNIASSKAMDGYPCNLLLSPSSSPLFGTVTRIIGDMVSRLALGQYLIRLRYCALREVFLFRTSDRYAALFLS